MDVDDGRSVARLGTTMGSAAVAGDHEKDEKKKKKDRQVLAGL